MTHPINRNNTDGHYAIRKSLSVEHYNKWNHNGKIADYNVNTSVSVSYSYISNYCAHDYSHGVLDRQNIARKVHHRRGWEP